jgi:GNAT superfamily N-acetyltransferase
MSKPKFNVVGIASDEMWDRAKDFIYKQFENPLPAIYYYASQEGRHEVIGVLFGDLYGTFTDAHTGTTVFDCFVIKGVAVAQSERRRGCGRALVRTVEDELREVEGVTVNFYAEVLDQSVEFWTSVRYERIGKGSALWERVKSRSH